MEERTLVLIRGKLSHLVSYGYGYGYGNGSGSGNGLTAIKELGKE